MAAAGEAIAATAASHVAFAADQLSRMKIVDVRSDCNNFTDKLVADDHGHRDSRAGPRVPVIYMKVGAANSGEQHADFDVVNSELRLGHIFEPQPTLATTLYQGFHDLAVHWLR